MRNKKYTQEQRISRLEKVVTQLFLTNKMIQDELKILQDAKNTNNDTEKE
jgi:hypothetical protein